MPDGRGVTSNATLPLLRAALNHQYSQLPGRVPVSAGFFVVGSSAGLQRLLNISERFSNPWTPDSSQRLTMEETHEAMPKPAAAT